jgi:hypothetical protein
MNAYDRMQWTIIALAVIASAAYALMRLAPGLVRRTRTQLALVFLHPQRGQTSRRFGRWLAPRPQSAGAGCGSGSCNGCSDARPAARSS